MNRELEFVEQSMGSRRFRLTTTTTAPFSISFGGTILLIATMSTRV